MVSLYILLYNAYSSSDCSDDSSAGWYLWALQQYQAVTFFVVSIATQSVAIAILCVYILPSTICRVTVFEHNRWCLGDDN